MVFQRLVSLALSTAPTRAHAFLDHASPLVGSTVSAPPHEVRLWFTQALEPKFSTAQVRSSAGSVVGTAHVNPGDPKELVIPVRALSPGRVGDERALKRPSYPFH